MRNALPCNRHLTLSALANMNRLSIIAHLQRTDMSVNELAAALGLQQTAVSQHLIKMKEAGLVTVRRHRQSRIYSLLKKPDTLFAKMIEIDFLQPQDKPEQNNPDKPMTIVT